MRTLATTLLASIMLLAACGDSDSVEDATATSTSQPSETTSVDTTPDTIPADEVRVPSRGGAVSGLLGSESEPESEGDAAGTDGVAQESSCAVGADCEDPYEGDDPDSEDCAEDDLACQDGPRPTDPPRPEFVVAAEHRAYCTTLADLEERDQPPIESDEGVATIESWLIELESVTPAEMQPTIARLRTNFLWLVDMFFSGEEFPDDFEQDPEVEPVLAQLDADAQALEDYTDWACFGEGSFDGPPDELPTPPATTEAVVDPAVAVYCQSFEELVTDIEQLEEDPELLVSAVVAWFDEVEPLVPDAIADDFATLHRWYDDAALEFTPQELIEGDLDLAPVEVSEAANRFGEWSDDTCQI